MRRRVDPTDAYRSEEERERDRCSNQEKKEEKKEEECPTKGKERIM